MKHDESTTEYLKDIEHITLSPEARDRMRTRLSEYADFHAIEGAVRVGEHDRSIGDVQQRAAWSSLFRPSRSRHMYTNATVLIALLVGGGGTAAAAQSAIPGDMLYPVKIHVNENVRNAVTVGANAEAELQAELLKERVAEAEALASEGRLTGETAADAEARIAFQAEVANNASQHADADVATVLRAELATVLTEAKSTLAAHGESAAKVTTGLGTALDLVTGGSVHFGTELSSGVNMDALIDNAIAHAAGLRSTITATAGLAAETRAEFMADLERAETLIAEAQASMAADARAEAEATITAATEIIGEIEAALSLLGELTIDPDTAAVIGIDLTGSAGADEGTREVEGSASLDAEAQSDLIDGSTSVGSVTNGNIDLGI